MRMDVLGIDAAARAIKPKDLDYFFICPIKIYDPMLRNYALHFKKMQTI